MQKAEKAWIIVETLIRWDLTENSAVLLGAVQREGTK